MAFHLRQREGLVVEQGNYAFLTEEQLDDSLTFVLVEVLFIILDVLSDVVDSDSETVLRRVHLLLSLFLVLLAFCSHFVDGVLQQNLQLRLAAHFLRVLRPCCFHIFAFMLHHFAQLVNHSFVPLNLLFLALNFSGRSVRKWTRLLVESVCIEIALVEQSGVGSAAILRASCCGRAAVMFATCNGRHRPLLHRLDVMVDINEHRSVTTLQDIFALVYFI